MSEDLNMFVGLRGLFSGQTGNPMIVPDRVINFALDHGMTSMLIPELPDNGLNQGGVVSPLSGLVIKGAESGRLYALENPRISKYLDTEEATTTLKNLYLNGVPGADPLDKKFVPAEEFGFLNAREDLNKLDPEKYPFPETERYRLIGFSHAHAMAHEGAPSPLLHTDDRVNIITFTRSNFATMLAGGREGASQSDLKSNTFRAEPANWKVGPAVYVEADYSLRQTGFQVMGAITGIEECRLGDLSQDILAANGAASHAEAEHWMKGFYQPLGIEIDLDAPVQILFLSQPDPRTLTVAPPDLRPMPWMGGPNPLNGMHDSIFMRQQRLQGVYRKLVLTMGGS